MAEGLAKMFEQLASYGPIGIVAALFLFLYFIQRRDIQREREKNERLSDKLHEISKESIKADVAHSQAYDRLEQVMNAAIKALANGRLRNGTPR